MEENLLFSKNFNSQDGEEVYVRKILHIDESISDIRQTEDVLTFFFREHLVTASVDVCTCFVDSLYQLCINRYDIILFNSNLCSLRTDILFTFYYIISPYSVLITMCDRNTIPKSQYNYIFKPFTSVEYMDIIDECIDVLKNDRLFFKRK